MERASLVGRRFRMTYEEWRTWEVEGLKAEWVEGVAVVSMPTTLHHADSQGFLSTLLTAYVRFRDLGAVLGHSFEMRLVGRSRLPDLLFVRAAHRQRLSEDRLEGPADLVIELVSTDSVVRDHGEKRAEYAAAGVPEYWVVEARPGRRGGEFLRLVDGSYEPILVDAGGRLWSTVVDGFWLDPAWLGQDPLPDPLDCLFEIAPEILAAKVR